MSARVTVATALRVLDQLRRDPRTIALLLGVPPFLLALLKGAFDQDPASFQRIGGPLVGIFPFSRCSSSPRSRCCASARRARSSG